MAFVFFEGSRQSASSAPSVTIRRDGLIVLNAAATEMLGEDVTHVQIGYDEEKGAIGIRAASAEAIGKYRLRMPPRGASRLVNGKRMLAHYGLDVEKAETYTAESFGEGIIGFYLNGKPEEVSEEQPEKAPEEKATKRTRSRVSKKAA